MNPHLLPAQLPDDMPAWTQTVMAFLVEKERRSGSRRTSGSEETADQEVQEREQHGASFRQRGAHATGPAPRIGEVEPFRLETICSSPCRRALVASLSSGS